MSEFVDESLDARRRQRDEAERKRRSFETVTTVGAALFNFLREGTGFEITVKRAPKGVEKITIVPKEDGEKNEADTRG